MTNETETKELVPSQLMPVPRTLPSMQEIQVMNQLVVNFEAARGHLFPKEIANRAALFAVLEAGREMGAPPMVALRHMFLVNGKAQPDAELMEAAVRARDGSADFVWHSASAERCDLELRRAGKTPVRLAYDMADVPKHLREKGGPWTQYSADMLRWFTMKRVCRMGAADLINALSGVEVTEAETMMAEADIPDAAYTVLEEIPAAQEAEPASSEPDRQQIVTTIMTYLAKNYADAEERRDYLRRKFGDGAVSEKGNFQPRPIATDALEDAARELQAMIGEGDAPPTEGQAALVENET